MASATIHVLVAEDNPVNQRLAIAALKRVGCTGMVVDDGEQALRCLARHTFDLVLMDVMMPNMDGLAALAAIRDQERLGRAHMPVVMATAHDLPGDREKLLAAGADGYLAKPIQSEALRKELLRVLGRAG